MNKTYSRINWENEPSKETPINERNLNKIDYATNEIDNRVITLDETKATKTEVSTLFKEVSFEQSTGIITFTRKNGATVTIDTPMEKIALNIYYDPITEMLTLPLVDGTQYEVDLSRLITEYNFVDSDTIAFSVSTDGKVSAIVKEGSIQEKHLQPNYLSEIKVEAAKAELSAENALESEENAKASENAAKESETVATMYATSATTSATNAANSANTATTKAEEAANSANSASSSATTATNKANEASASATSANTSASTATSNANAASISSTNADTYAKQAQSYAVGTGNVRPNEATDNSKYYYEQAKSISESFAGALRPMGTVTFANLPTLSAATEGDMYNISDEFTTNSDFKEGSGKIIPAGSNVYKTADGKWDILAGTPVTSVNGETGNVTITKASVGLENVGNFKAVSTVASQGLTDAEKSNARANIGAGTSSFSGNYNDLSNKPNIPTSLPANGGTSTATGKLNESDTRSINSPPSYYMDTTREKGIVTEFKIRETIGLSGSGFVQLTTFSQWNDPAGSGGYPAQIATGNSGGIYYRVGESYTSWGNWVNLTAYSLPAASSSTRGGVKTGYTANGKNYPVQLDNEKMYVNVAWTDTNTTYSVMTGATAITDGKAGLVPAPAKGNQSKYLNGSGQWTTMKDDSKLSLTGGTLTGSLIIAKAAALRLTASDNIIHTLSGYVGGADEGGIFGIDSNLGVVRDDKEARVTVTNDHRAGRLVSSGAGNFGIYDVTGLKWLLACNGTTAFTQYSGFSTLSDERDKADLQPLSNCLEFINNVNPISFYSNPRRSYEKQEDELTDEDMETYKKYWFKPYDKEAHKNGEKRGDQRRVGVSAQQTIQALEKIYGSADVADIVHDNFHDLYKNGEEIPEGVESTLMVTYTCFIPYLIGSVHELTEKIKELEEENIELHNQLEEIRSILKSS